MREQRTHRTTNKESINLKLNIQNVCINKTNLIEKKNPSTNERATEKYTDSRISNCNTDPYNYFVSKIHIN